MAQGNEVELGTIGSEKTNTHSVKVAIREWNGDLGVDIRRWYKFGSEWKATTKGIRLRAGEISEAITYLERAEKELKDKGILK
jgi:hypothetical protein